MRTSNKYVLSFTLACFFVGLGWVIGRFQYKHHSSYATTSTVTSSNLTFHLMHGSDHYWPMLFPRIGTAIRAVSNRGDSIILYKSEQVFQETLPFVHAIAIVNGKLQWDDGEREYSLSVVDKTSLTSH